MTVSNLDVKTTFVGDGTATVRTTSFRVFGLSELRIVAIDALGVESPLVEGVDYTLALATITLPAQVRVTPLAPIAVGVGWVAWRESADTQLADYPNAGTFPAASHEEQLDRAALRSGELRFWRDRAIRLPASQVDDDLILPAGVIRANKVLGFDADRRPAYFSPSVFVAGSYLVGALGEQLLGLANTAGALALLGYARRSASFETGASGLAAGRAAALLSLQGFYFALDTGEISYRSSFAGPFAEFGTGLRYGTLAARPAANADGSKFYRANDVGNDYTSDGAVWTLRRTVPPNHLSGGQITWNSNTSLTVGAAVARDAADVVTAVTTALQKNFNLAGEWSPGAGGNMRPSTVPNVSGTQYGIFLIMKSASGVWDFGLDDDSVATKLLLRANTISAGWDSFRRIGWAYNDAATGLHLCLQDGDNFVWLSGPKVAFTNASVDPRGSLVLSLAFTPPRVRANLIAHISNVGTAGDRLLFAHEDVGNLEPDINVAPGAHFEQGVSNVTMYTLANRLTNEVSQIQIDGRAAGDSSVALHIFVEDWIDKRGKDL